MSSEKLVLINPFFGEGGWGSVTTPPLGLMHLATYISQNSSITVEVIDPIPQKMTRQQVVAKAAGASYVGIAMFCDHRHFALRLASDIKAAWPDKPIIAGGPFTFFFARQLMERHGFLDYVVQGEGEETLLELLQARDPSSILGLTYRAAGEIASNAARPLAKDIDGYDCSYDLLPKGGYYVGDYEVPSHVRRFMECDILSSRGCPYKCSFCSNEHWSRRWRAVSADEVVRRIERAYKSGYRYFRMYDDLFTVDKRRVSDICDGIKAAGMTDIYLRCLIRADTDISTIQMLKGVGLVAVGFGIESANDDVLGQIDKRITVKDLSRTIDACREMGLWIVGSFIVGLPGQTEEHIRRDCVFSRKVDAFQCGPNTIYPYTPQYIDMKQRGLIDDSIWLDDDRYRIYYVKENFQEALFTDRELQNWWRWMRYQAYFRHPRNTFRLYGIVQGILFYVVGLLDVLSGYRLGDTVSRIRLKLRRFIKLGS